MKYKGKIYKGCNGYQRVELIDSVNDLCKNIDNPKVLEAGCGSGVNIYLLDSLNPNIEITHRKTDLDNVAALQTKAIGLVGKEYDVIDNHTVIEVAVA